MRGGEVGLMHISISFKTLKAPHLYRTSLQTLGKHLELAVIFRGTMADASFQQVFLEAHNAYRAKHSTPPMTLNSELSATAQKWADHLLANMTMMHSETKDGENIFNKSSSATLNLTGKEAVDSWYSEIKDYNWSSPGFTGNTGHFTQVVWKDSTELGVGMATNGNTVFVVGQYRPAGNISNEGYFEKNVLPLDEGGEVGLMHISISFKTLKAPHLYRTSLQTLGKHLELAVIFRGTMADASFQQVFLEAHNAYRAKHSTPPMTLNSELSATAQKWADHLLANMTMMHSETKDGENIFNKSSSATLNLTGKEAVDSWYSEIKDYNWSSPGFTGNTGHFTQVVWKDSTELGVGMATNGNTVFVVGQYRPAGNISNEGYFEKNVLPLG
ncbi:Ectin [Larimichthys crocea]|uniref:Ectin n=1 Tax=Larimichthys crocea TaxID=215358 RepID=A0A6G0IJL3_LARCR|nr:Ectin [Larimichthys crocea]